MPERVMNVLGSLPFMLLLSDERGVKTLKVNKTRIIEAILISCITGTIAGMLSSYVSLEKMDVKLSAIEKKVDQLDDRLWSHYRED